MGLIVIHQGGVFLEDIIILISYCLLQGHNGLWTIHVILCIRARTQTMETYRVQCCVLGQSHWIKGMIMAEGNTLCDFLQADSADPANGSGEVLINHFFRETDGFEDSCRLVGLQGGDTHLRCSLYNAGQDRLIVVLDCSMVILIQDAKVD